MKFKQYSFFSRVFRHFYAMPFIYSMIIPIVILDVFLEVYHRIAFPLYGLRYVRRARYIAIDRHKLSYLNVFEKIHCVYCGYVNGLLAYAVAVGGETEKYWCGIQHKKKSGFTQHAFSEDLLPYDDKEAFDKFVKKQAK